jgi:hypothetical protein
MDKVTIGNWKDFDESLRFKYDLKPDDLVIDIGSYRREFADKIIQMYGCKVECFDALDNRAAWKYNGKLAMGGDYLYTSIYAHNVNKEYWCVDIAPFLEKEVALVKINIEGGEYELLTYIIQKGLMKNIKNLQVQFHLVDGLDCQTMYELLFYRLSKTHNQTWGVPFVWENWERC